MRCCWAAAAALSTWFLSFSSCCWTDTKQHSPAFTPLGGIFTGFISGSLSKVSAGLHSATTFDVDTAGRRHSLYPCEYAEHRQLNAYNRHFSVSHQRVKPGAWLSLSPLGLSASQDRSMLGWGKSKRRNPAMSAALNPRGCPRLGSKTSNLLIDALVTKLQLLFYHLDLLWGHGSSF